MNGKTLVTILVIVLLLIGACSLVMAYFMTSVDLGRPENI